MTYENGAEPVRIKFLGTVNDLEEAVETRVERQRVIYKGGKRFVAVLEEQALRTWFGTAETQAGQLNRLLALMSLPERRVVALASLPMIRNEATLAGAGAERGRCPMCRGDAG